MRFVISKQRRCNSNPDLFSWVLMSKDGPVCESSKVFTTEVEARANIAAAKRAMAGAKFAKVEAP